MGGVVLNFFGIGRIEGFWRSAVNKQLLPSLVVENFFRGELCEIEVSKGYNLLLVSQINA